MSFRLLKLQQESKKMKRSTKSPLWLKRMADIAECEAMMAGEEEDIKNVKRLKEIGATKWKP
jgi:hypothetical protein